MRYRIVIEIEAEAKVSKTAINELAKNAYDEFVTKNTNPVYLSTEIVSDTIVLEKKQQLNGCYFLMRRIYVSIYRKQFW